MYGLLLGCSCRRLGSGGDAALEDWGVKRRFLGFPIFEVFFLLLTLMGIALALPGQLRLWLLETAIAITGGVAIYSARHWQLEKSIEGDHANTC